MTAAAAAAFVTPDLLEGCKTDKLVDLIDLYSRPRPAERVLHNSSMEIKVLEWKRKESLKERGHSDGRSRHQ